MKNLVKLTSIVAVAIFAAAQAHATLLGSDTFTYANGDLQTVSAGAWTNYSGTTALNVTNIAGNGLANPTGANSKDDGLILGTPGASNGVTYASFDVIFNSWPTGLGAYFAHFKDDTTSNFRSRIMVTNDSGSVRIGIANSASTSTNAGVAFWASTLALGTTNKIVIRLDQSSGSDVSTLWINPTLETDLSITAADAVTAGPAQIPITQFALRQSNASQGNNYVDNLLVGTSFADVVVPEPSTVLLVSAGMLGLFMIRRRRA
jgi:PEP-CTERM motif